MKKLTFCLIVVLSTSAYVAADMLLPSLPALTDVFKTTNTSIQLSISLYIVFLSISQLIAGSISDKFGRRNTILFGLTLGLAGITTCLYATCIEMFLLGRCIQACGLAAPTVLGRTIAADLCRGTKLAKYNSWLVMSMPVALTLAPIIGGYLHFYFGWQAIFQSLFVYNLLLLILSFYFLSETNFNLNKKALKINILIKNYKKLLINKQFIGFTMCAACGSGGMMAYLTEAPFLLQDISGLNSIQFGLTTSALCLTIFFSGYLSSYLVERFGFSNLVLLGSYIITISGCLMYILNIIIPNMILYSVLISTLIFLIGNTLISPNAATGAVTDLKENIGLANAIFATFRLIFGGITSFIIALIIVSTPKPLAICFFAVGMLSIIVFKFMLAPCESVDCVTD